MLHTVHGWWLEEAGPVEPAPPLEGEVSADLVIVGGGYTGLWTAWHALAAAPDTRVVLLEADVCGHGPSGRNGGFCESLWISIAALRERLGDERARALAEASSETVDAIGRWCEEQQVDAWYRKAPYIRAAASDATEGVGAAAIEAAAAVGSPESVRPIDQEEVRERCGSPLLRGGILIPDSATVQPARLALGLRARVQGAPGARLFEHCPVRSVRGGSGSVEVETRSGRVKAGAAVIAAGPALRGLRQLRNRMTVASSHIVLTEPVPDLLEELGWTGGESITDGRTLVHYFRTTRDGRIAFGWGGGRLMRRAGRDGNQRRVDGFGVYRPQKRPHGSAGVERDPTVVEQVRRDLLRLFPQVRGRRITHAWGGPIDVSPSHLPQVGRLPDGPVYYAFGYTGNGVGPSHLIGRVLASRALGRDDEAARLPLPGPDPARVPPEPLAWLGGALVRRAWVRRERLEDQGLPVDPLTRAACAVPGLLGIHLAR
ncbi:MAG: NAD(P)/FAD-dependent oxidoreductase [Thermoleophilaceae bacterium]